MPPKGGIACFLQETFMLKWATLVPDDIYNTNGLKLVWNGADFLTLTHSPYTISRFTSYLKLLLLPEVKYGECLLPVDNKKLRVCQSLARWQRPVK